MEPKSKPQQKTPDELEAEARKDGRPGEDNKTRKVKKEREEVVGPEDDWTEDGHDVFTNLRW